MSLDDINYVEFSPKMKLVGELPPTTKLRDETFKKTNQTWKKNLLIENYKKIDDIEHGLADLKVKKEDLAEAESQILEKSTVIARLEATIKYINREEVPNNFIGSRAIKLKDEWLEMVKMNSAEAYKEPEVIPFVQPQENNVPENTIIEEDITNFVDKAFEEKIDENKDVEEAKKEIINEANIVDVNDKVSNIAKELFPDSYEEKIATEEISEEIPLEDPASNNNIEEKPVNVSSYETGASTMDKIDDKDNSEEVNIELPVKEEKITIHDIEDKAEVSEEIKIPEFTFENPEDNEEDIDSVKEEVSEKVEETSSIEPIDIGKAVITSEAKENVDLNMLSIEDLLKLRNDKQKEREEITEEKNKALQEKEEAERINAEKEAEKTAKEEAIKNALLQEIGLIDSDKEKLDSDIQNIKEATANVNRDTEIKTEGIAKLNEIEIMMGENTVSEVNDIPKTM